MTTKLTTSGRTEEIRELHELAQDDVLRSIKRAIRIGELLVEQKSELNHGEWIPWVEENLPFGRIQAFNYMNIFKKQDKVLEDVQHGEHLPMRDAVQMLATPKPKSFPIEEIVPEPDDELDAEWEEVDEVVEVTRVQKSDILQDAKIFDQWDKTLRELNKEIMASTGTSVGAWIYTPFYNQAMKKLRSVLAGFKPVEICCDAGCEECRGTGFLSKVERDKK